MIIRGRDTSEVHNMPSGPRLYRIAEPFGRRLAVSGRPHGWSDLEQQVAWWKKSGVDVIVLHRLLKNEVQGSEYILLTEPAFRFLSPPGDYLPHLEHYDDVGDIPLHLRSLKAQVPAAAPRRFSIADIGRKLSYEIGRAHV